MAGQNAAHQRDDDDEQQEQQHVADQVEVVPLGGQHQGEQRRQHDGEGEALQPTAPGEAAL